MLSIPLERLGYIIEKAREFDVQTEAVDSDSGSNPTDDGEIRVLEDTIANPAQEELAAALDGLDNAEKIEVLALVWLGRGDFTVAEWPTALAQAREIHDARETAYLIGTPLLADYLAEGLAALGLSPQGYDPGLIAGSAAGV